MSDSRRVTRAKKKLTFEDIPTIPCSVILPRLNIAQSTPLAKASKRKYTEATSNSSGDSLSEIESDLDQEQFIDLSSPRKSPVGRDNDTITNFETSKSELDKTVDNLTKTEFFRTALELEPVEVKTEIMASISSTQMVDIIPKCTSAEDVEQFVAIVDRLNKQLKNEDTPLFLAIVSAKVQKKAFDAIKGITIEKWDDMKEALTKGLEQKIDRATATNRLMHIKQNTKESLKDYTARVKDALAVLNRATIREISNDATRKCMIEQNDAIAKNTFESGIKDDKLKTIVVASKEKTFNDSHNCAVNQQQTNFPTEDKNITCFYCGKPNHTANECFKKRNEIRSKSASPGTSGGQYSNFNKNNSNYSANRNFSGNSYNSSFDNQNRNASTNSFGAQNRNPSSNSYNNYSNNQNRGSNGGSYNNSYGNQSSNQASNRTNNFNGNTRNNSYNNNSGYNANNSNNRSNWNRSPAPNTNTNNNNRNNSTNTNVRVLRDAQDSDGDMGDSQLRTIREEEDWDQILPFPTTTEDQGN